MCIDDLPSTYYPWYSTKDESIKKRKGWVYVVKTPKGYKIGKTHSLKARIKQLAKEFFDDIEIIHFIHFDEFVSEKEKACHELFKDKNNGFRLEYFDLSNKDIELIKSEIFIDKVLNIESKIAEKNKEEHTKNSLRKIRKLEKKKDAINQELKKINEQIRKELNWYKEYPSSLQRLTTDGQIEVMKYL
ncbi:GIY-YIG nuclease family protein [Arcobacter arenosus]|uniref:GIY-YIG nuclease family protein n=1 Tax=Arcobacter arenosus TaxID=2576037 RepID=A0A5R8Y6D5_9BACT|nr:GIY-YIG nuclease family protein [Arcobacter arenosus]TLP41062.1 GIY-YIG nuclease family protein [Arcobacter arenosus]